MAEFNVNKQVELRFLILEKCVKILKQIGKYAIETSNWHTKIHITLKKYIIPQWRAK